jgi:EmrB/QacA subfamily drug resistance transporter
MMTALNGRSTSTSAQPGADRRRWKALGVLALIQYMLVIDMTVVNIALPQIQDELRFSAAGLVWLVDGYALTAGGLLLVGGRMADVVGRRRMFLIGLGVFAAASAMCGAATMPAMLVAGRFLQGAGEAMAAPASLGLIVVLFSDHGERTRALGVWGGVSALGGVTGVVISGALVGFTSWRWIFFVNLPIALFALLMMPLLVSESRMVRDDRRLDVTGAFVATAGLVLLVVGLIRAASYPWASWQVLLPLVAGLGLVAAMVPIEARSASPLIPLQFFANRTRVTANLVTVFTTAAFFTYVFLLTLFLQQVLDFSPLESGLAYVPMGLAIGAGAGIGTALMPRIGVKPLMCAGSVGIAVGLLLTSGIDVGVSYATGVLPGMVVLGVGAGVGFPTITNAALHETTGQDAGLGSGVQNAMSQIGGAVGLACLVTMASRQTRDAVDHGTVADVAATNGYVLAFHVAAGLLAGVAVLVLLLVESVSAKPTRVVTEPGAHRFR